MLLAHGVQSRICSQVKECERRNKELEEARIELVSALKELDIVVPENGVTRIDPHPQHLPHSSTCPRSLAA